LLFPISGIAAQLGLRVPCPIPRRWVDGWGGEAMSLCTFMVPTWIPIPGAALGWEHGWSTPTAYTHGCKAIKCGFLVLRENESFRMARN